ncbi:MAG: DUF3870 domain-containing protein [Thermotaleaceae bacterium]
MAAKKIFISGYAKLPKGITATEMYSVIAVGLLVNRYTGEILEADCSLVTATAQKFFRNNMVGENINHVDTIEKMFNDNYFGSAKKAIISALRTCHEKYKQAIEGAVESDEEE